ncbi:MAG: hypothetical protein AB7D96_05420 [Arcobacteraceae bacterium]
MNIDDFLVKLEQVKFQLDHHTNVFETKWWDVAESSREISNKKLELEYFTYFKILKNLSEEVEQIMEIGYKSDKG